MADMANRLLDQLLWWLRFEYIRGIDDHSTSEYIRLFKQVCWLWTVAARCLYRGSLCLVWSCGPEHHANRITRDRPLTRFVHGTTRIDIHVHSTAPIFRTLYRRLS